VRLCSGVAEVVALHHTLGLTGPVRRFAGELRAAGHIVHTPDLYDGRRVGRQLAGDVAGRLRLQLHILEADAEYDVAQGLDNAWGTETRSGGELVFSDEAAEEVAPAQGD
jgi:dienelactone hydrolase